MAGVISLWVATARQLYAHRKIKMAYRAYARQLPQLIKEHNKEWIAMDWNPLTGAKQVAIAPTAQQLYDHLNKREIPIHPLLIRRIEEQKKKLQLNW
ncbi:MAG: hypothetical protein WDO70_06705 [Alphaproteobacteria bacterium]